MKTKTQFTNRILSLALALMMVVGMLPMTAFAATEVSGWYKNMVAYSDGVTQYFTYNNYLYKVTYTNLRPEKFTNVALSRSPYDYVQLFKTTSIYVFLYRNHDSADRVKTSDLPKSEGSSLSCYGLYGYDNAVNQEQPIVIITCIAVNEPTWNWNGTSSATATFTAKEADVFTTANATISSENDAANTKTIYTATVTFNGTKYTDTKIVSVPHEHPICGDSDCSDSAHTVNDSWTAWDGTTAFPGGNVYLSDDVILTAPISVTGIVSLCLNGHSIDAAGGYFDVSGNGTLNLCSCKDNGVFKRTSTTNALISADNGATVNLYNVTLDGGAVWGGTTDAALLRGTANSGIVSDSPLIDAGYQRTTGGHITLNSGVILQNNECSDAGDGGAVTVGEDGTLVINGATIRNNAKEDGNAGAIKAYAGAKITLNSGEIYGNSAYKHGGAIQIFGGDSTDYTDAVLTMNGGSVRNNKATGVGGGVAVSNYSQFIMNGGSIIDNATTDSQKRGGGVGFADADTAMSVSGNAVISGNTANNLYIGTISCNKLTVGVMGNDARIGVTMKSSSGGVFTDGGAAYVERFYSDDSDFSVTVDGENLKLSHIHSYTYTANNNVITETCTCGHSETATITAPAGIIVYDGSEKDGASVSYSNGWMGGPLTVTYVNNIHAGQATASITKAGATASVKFTINKAEPDYTLPMGVTATYGETLANISISNWGSGWSWKDPGQSVGNAGTHSFKAVFTPNDANYNNIEVDVTVTVRKASLTVTANDKVITYGDAPANGGVTYEGFVSGENADVLGGSITYNCAYSQYDSVGTYDITVSGLTSDNYEITYVKGTLTVQQKEVEIEWMETMYMPYTGQLVLPKAIVKGLADGDSCEVIISFIDTAEGAGINPGGWRVRITGLSNPNYKLAENSSVPLEITYTIYARQTAPVVAGVAETIKGKNDGHISGLTTEMEYATKPNALNRDYTKITDPNMTFAPGTYYVRYPAKPYYYASVDTEVTISAGGMLTVTVPATQTGYTVLAAHNELEWNGSTTLSFVLKEGYSKTSAFAVKINGNPVELNAANQHVITNAQENIVITVEGVADTTPPAAEVKVADNGWTQFLNDITFGLFFKDTQDVTITVTDAGSGVNSIEYYLANAKLSQAEVEGITSWEGYNGTFKINPDNEYVIYVKVTDNDGNVGYISSDGVVLDATAPVISGVENGKTYYTTQKVTVTEKNVASIKLNGEDAGANITLDGNKETTYTIVATDKAGNSTTVTVTMKPISDISAPIDNLTKDNVNSGNEQTVDGVKAAVAAVDTTNATEQEKAALKEISDKADELEKVIDDTKAEIARINEELNKYDGNTVNSDDAAALEQLGKDIKALTDGGNLTDAERTALTEGADAVAAMQKTVADTVAENDRISDAVDGYDLATVTSDDKADLEQLLDDIKEQLESTNLTEEEITELNGDKKAVEDLLTKIKGTDELIDKLTEDVDGYSDDTVKSTDKDAIEQIIEDIDALLETENLTDAEEKALEDAKAKAEGLLDTIEDAAEATTSENTEKVKDVTAENVTPEDKTDLENAKADLEKVLEDKVGNYTDEEKKAIEDEIKRIDDALEVIGNVEEVEELIGKLPENITKKDEDAIKAADDAYNALTDYEKSLVDEDAKKALDDAKAALAELNKPADPNSPATGDNSNMFLWIALLFISGGAVITLTVVDRKKRTVNK